MNGEFTFLVKVQYISNVLKGHVCCISLERIVFAFLIVQYRMNVARKISSHYS
jgi:hypothetical protein